MDSGTIHPTNTGRWATAARGLHAAVPERHLPNHLPTSAVRRQHLLHRRSAGADEHEAPQRAQPPPAHPARQRELLAHPQSGAVAATAGNAAEQRRAAAAVPPGVQHQRPELHSPRHDADPRHGVSFPSELRQQHREHLHEQPEFFPAAKRADVHARFQY